MFLHAKDQENPSSNSQEKIVTDGGTDKDGQSERLTNRTVLLDLVWKNWGSNKQVFHMWTK